jgi:hypothetical protein
LSSNGLASRTDRLVRLDGGWAWKGPGHPVDNGERARGQRAGLRSEGAARALFLARRVRLSWSRPGGSFRVRHDSADRFVNPGEREYGDIMACTVRDTSC